jgi:hypothetical protein
VYPFPGNHSFAFSIFDDTDGSTVENTASVYKLLSGVGMRTTKSVWPLSCVPGAPFPGSTLQDAEYRDFVVNLKEDGFEIALHNVRNADSTRERVCEGLDIFQRTIGAMPRAHANHAFNRDNIYWGPERLSGRWTRWAYSLATQHRYESSYWGHVEGSPYFWGDICQQHLSYVRKFVFGEINLKAIDAAVPYHDSKKEFVRYWFNSSEGGNAARFCQLLSERNQDRLDSENGICVVYTHFAEGFVKGGCLNPRFEYLMRRLANKNGWFVPVSTLMDYLRAGNPRPELDDERRATLERRWLLHKFRIGPT